MEQAPAHNYNDNRLDSYPNNPSNHSNPSPAVTDVSTKQLYPADPPPPGPRPDTSNFVIIMYTSLSVNQDHKGPPQVEAARTLQSMGYPPPSTAPRTVDHPAPASSAPPVTHLTAIAGSGTITMSAAGPPPPGVSAASTAPIQASTIQAASHIAPSHAMPPMRPPQPYSASIDPFYRDAALRQSMPLQRFTPENTSTDIRAYQDQYIDPRSHPQQAYQMDHLHRVQDYHQQPLHHQEHHQQDNQQHQLQPTHLSQLASQPISLARDSTPLTHAPMHPPPGGPPVYNPHQYDRSLHLAPQASLPDTTALSRQPRPNGSLFRADASVPATPTTPATSATQPFPPTPSSPDNNGASSNGSGQREHACTYPGCTKTFDRRYNLTVHYRRHTDEMPYPCKFPGCTQKFKWRSSQSHHMKTRHQMRSAGRGARNNAVRQRGNSSGANRTLRYPVANGSVSRSMAQSQIPGRANGLQGNGIGENTNGVGLSDAEDKGSYKRAFSPRKRQRVTHDSS